MPVDILAAMAASALADCAGRDPQAVATVQKFYRAACGSERRCGQRGINGPDARNAHERQQEDRMQDPRAKNLIGNPQRLSRRHMLSLGATAMAAAGLLQQLGIISAANAENFPPEELQGLVVHNVYRMTIQCVGPMGFDPDATMAARDWATRSPQDTNAQGQVTFEHDPNRGAYGENMAWGPNLTAAQAVALWYAENTLYDFNSPGFSPTTGAFHTTCLGVQPSPWHVHGETRKRQSVGGSILSGRQYHWAISG